jgi:chromosome segregation ATPase
MWEALAGIAAVLGALAGIIKWLLSEYFKKAEALEETKKQLTDRSIENLKEIVDEHKIELKTLGSKLKDATTTLQSHNSKLDDLEESLIEYIEQTKTRIEKLESQIIKLGTDLILIKGAKDGQKNK